MLHGSLILKTRTAPDALSQEGLDAKRRLLKAGPQYDTGLCLVLCQHSCIDTWDNAMKH